MIQFLFVIFFLSGASALIFESIWFQLCGLVFGNSVWAVSIVLASFMAGLALGNGLIAAYGHRIQRPVRVYAFFEFAIAISGIALIFLLPNMTEILVPFFRLFSEQQVLLNMTRAGLSMALMIVPATAMGATLPILVKAIYRNQPNFGSVLGVLYGYNTLGATCGVLVAEIFFIRWFGIRGAGFVAALFNIVAGGLALYLSPRLQAKPGVQADEISATPSTFRLSPSLPILAAGFLSGFILLALEVLWFRFVILFFSAHGWNFAIMLAVVLAGISLGGLFASVWFRKKSEAHVYLFHLSLMNGILVIILYAGFEAALFLCAKFPMGTSEDVLVTIASVFLMFPVSFVSGILFTMIGKRLHEKMGVEVKAAGMLTLANTLGAMAGSLLAGLVFIPLIGIELSFFVMALLYGVIALLIHQKKHKETGAPNAAIPKNFAYIVTGVFLLLVILFPFGMMKQTYLKYPIKRHTQYGERRVALVEGMTETVQYLEKDLLNLPHYHRLVTNNHTMSSTTWEVKRYTKLYVYWARAIKPDLKNALLICFGCGSTAKAMKDTRSLERIDIVDISKEIIESSKVVYPEPAENPVHDPRVDVHIEDGRFFLLTTQKPNDFITAEPPPPKHSKIVNLYTREYFELMRNRLKPGGVVTYWLPVYQLSTTETRSILRAFADVFKNCSVWTGFGVEWMMAGIREPMKNPGAMDFASQWKDPNVGPEMRALGFKSPEQFGSLFVADGKRLESWIGDALPLTDNFPMRLSITPISMEEKNRSLPVYLDFMDPKASRENFFKSKNMKIIWPETYRKKSSPHFSVRRMINEMSFDQNQIFMNYYRCMNEPLLNGYEYWALRSDNDARNIIDRVMSEREKIDMVQAWPHLAAQAARKREFRTTLGYINWALQTLGIENVNLEYHPLRMYLYYLIGENEAAEKAGNLYINLLPAGREERREKIESYRDLIQRQNISTGLKPLPPESLFSGNDLRRSDF